MTGKPQLRIGTLARELLRNEQQDAKSGCPLGACHAVLGRLYGELETLIGRGAFHALLIRALALAGKDHPHLRRIDIRQASAPGLADLRENLSDLEPDNPETVASALVTEFLGLLTRILGHEHTRAILRAGWPEVMGSRTKTREGPDSDD